MVHGTHNAVDNPLNEHVKIYVCGEFLDRKDAKISVFDSGYLVGDGIWEGIRLHNGVLVFLDQHLNRLWDAASVVGMPLKFSREELEQIIWDTIKINGMSDGVHIRVMITRGIKKTPSQDPRLTISDPNLVVIAEHKEASNQSRERGLRLFTSSFRRGSPDYLDPRLNCHSKLHEVQALMQAIEAGCDEALMLDNHGFVATCNSTNFFMVKDNEVWTSTGQYCMNGITRNNVIKLCEAHGIVCRQKNFSLYDTYSADEAFVTGTFGGLTPVRFIDGKAVGKGSNPMTQKLSELYEALIQSEVSSNKAS